MGKKIQTGVISWVNLTFEDWKKTDPFSKIMIVIHKFESNQSFFGIKPLSVAGALSSLFFYRLEEGIGSNSLLVQKF